MNPVYLDHNASTPIEKEVTDAMMPFLFEHFGNPSSSHYYGIITREALEKARLQVAGFINCNPDQIIFTSGGTESNNYALKGAAFHLQAKGNHLITSQVEHPAIINVCKYLENHGFETTYLPVDEYGIVNPSDVEAAITHRTILLSIMHANNEVGSIQPIREISEIARDHKIVFHTDAAQSAGKIPVDVDELGVDLLSLAGHKIYAPKGVGALYLRRGVKLEKQMNGATQEFGLRAGTENVLEIVGLGKACEIARSNLAGFAVNMKKMRDTLYDLLTKNISDIRLNGHPEKRLPNTLSIGFKYCKASELIENLENLAVSAGAACHLYNVEISPVLKAMNVPPEYAVGTLRISTGRHTSFEEIEIAAESIIRAVKKLRKTG